MRRVALVLLCVMIGAGALAAWLFPRAFPTVALENRISRTEALQRADSFFRAHDLVAAGSRRAVRFREDDSLLTFVDLAGGGRDTLEQLVRGRDVAPYTWSVRAFVPRDPHESRAHFAPDGRIVGFQRQLAEADRRPTLAPDSAQRLATVVLTSWISEPAARWRLATSSYETKTKSGRVDRTFTFERVGRTVAGAPIRLDVVIAGDLPSLAKPYVVIPESFSRRYGEMRSSNLVLSAIDTIAILVLGIGGVIVLRKQSRERGVRWRQPFVVGAVIGALLVAAGLNDLLATWFDYDTAMSPAVFEATVLGGAIAGGVLMGLVVALTLAAGEAVARMAFPDHVDWWALWRQRGTREVAGRVLGGYAVGAIALAYVAAFYIITRRVFGWWVPTELLDDPNQIATPLPWISGIALSLQAGVWEETLFRALPLSLLSLWVGQRHRRGAWMAGGVIVTALVFGFAHAAYPSWPPYSRAVEIFIDACFWGALFLQFGLIVTVIGHFLYDLTLFGLFVAAGTAPAYRATAAIILLALLAPALAVAWRWIRQRQLGAVPPDARFGAWVPSASEAAQPVVEPPRHGSLTPRTRQLALLVVIVGVVASIAVPRAPVLGPPYAASRARAITVADSMLRAHGGAGDLSGWRRLAGPATDTLTPWPRFLHEQSSEQLAFALDTSYEIPAWWTVRYVHTSGPLASRAEEWRIRVRPDGRPLDLRHIVPDSAPGAAPSPDEARRIARQAIVRAGLDTARLYETAFSDTARPARHDMTVIYTDSGTPLPAGATARVWVELAGAEPVLVRRGVNLPDAFLRDDRDRQMTRVVIGVAGGILLLGGIITGTIFVIRRRPPMHDDLADKRRVVIWAAVGIAALEIAQSVNRLPSELFPYDTTMPWSNFLTTIGVGLAVAGLPALMLFGLWLVTDALRRRVGIRWRSDEAGASHRDTLVAGIALGALFAAARLLSDVAPTGVPPSPHTSLNDALPWLSDAMTLPAFIAAAIALLPIPILMIGAISRRWRVRIAFVVAFAILAGLTALPAAATTPTVLGATLAAVGAIALVLAIPTWGRLGVLVWIFAALAERMLVSAHNAIYAPTGVEHLAAALAVVVSLAFLWLLAKWADTAPLPPPSSPAT